MLDNHRNDGLDSQTATGASQAQPPAISLPKGGGAIRGIDEKFSVNPATGTGSFSIPIATSPGRSGFGAQLTLNYDSGAGNGPFGLGWNLPIPTISRKTDKGLPRYRDAEESDVFILSGAEDLVPALVRQGDDWTRDIATRQVDGEAYTVQRYRPRIEGLFARIERWTNRQTGEIHWRSISRDNITTLYGKTAESRIADPDDPTKVFSWLICESYDDKGNAIVYEYKKENSDSVGLSQLHEKNRSDVSRLANYYLKWIKYGNLVSRLLQPNLPQADWRFEVVFDYGEHHPDDPTPNDPGEWLCRHDPFSSYRAGFEVRTYRLCQRVLMFHHFPDEEDVGQDCLVRSTDFVYRDMRNNPEDLKKGHPVASFIASITQSGYKRLPEGGYLKKSLPPLEFEYSQADIDERVQEIDPESVENLPYGLDGSNYQWVDLDGEGLSGILTEQAGGWFYKRNLSPAHRVLDNGAERTDARFAPVELVIATPNTSLAGGQAQLIDLAGDGQVDLVQLDGPVRGFYERTHDANWVTFRPFTHSPNLDTRDPNLKLIDLDGDGHTDILVSEDDVFSWHASLAEQGFGPAVSIGKPDDEEKGPRLVFDDGTQSIYLADFCGDGLTDLVRIRNGEVCYWPNLGYGRFGAKVTMDNAPWFDAPDLFDQHRIRLADIDGSGVTDILYLGTDGVRIYVNQSGNGWSAARTLEHFPAVDNLASVQALDLLGNGTACLVWSSPLPGDALRPMRYIDLMGGQKPHLLIGSRNNLGAETRVHYAPSTKFYVQDRLDGAPWITRVPFPVHVVERIETYDHISRNRFVTRYAYHHGYFDGEEREFRGFGMVEQFDTEAFAAFTEGGTLPEATNLDAASHVPPVLTRTWFHTGVYLGHDRVSQFFAGLLDGQDRGEYYRERAWLHDDDEAKKHLLPDAVLPDGLAPEEEREAARALKGMMLRREIYALDGVGRDANYPDGHPYTVAEQNFTIRLLQPRGGNRHAVFFAHPNEALTYDYERQEPADPRIQHALTLEVDPFGNVLKEAAIGYGRRQPDPSLPLQGDRDKQTTALVTYTENRVTNAMDDDADPDNYRTPLPAETRTYELTGYTPTGAAGRFQSADFVQPDPADPDGVNLAHIFDSEIQYEDQPTNGKQRRLIEHVRTLYRRNDLAALLPLSTIESLALPGESYKLAFTPGLVTQVYGGRVTDAMLENEGRYVHSEGDASWWLPSGRVLYSENASDTTAQELAFARQHFFLSHRFRDPFGETASVTYAHDLLIARTTDPLGNTVLAQNDFRVLQPALVTDPNGNRSQAAFDALGMVVGIAVMGKAEDETAGETEGDSLAGFVADLDKALIQDHIQNPLANPHAILQRATTRLVYDLEAFRHTRSDPQPQPAVVYTLARETHDADLEPGQQTKVQHSFAYSDGFGRVIQQKIQAEPGPVPERDPETGQVITVDGHPQMTADDASPRWVGSGWTIFNNKGKPVRQYEPYFTDTHRFEFDVRIGVSPVLFYDPIGRVVATLHPNHTWEKVVFDPWRQETSDVNDTVLVADPKDDLDVGDFFRRLPDSEYLPTWHEQRITDGMGAAEQDAADEAAVHANTPGVAHFDSLGRTVLTVAHNKFIRNGATIEEQVLTRTELDIEGKPLAVIDPLGRRVMEYRLRMLQPDGSIRFTSGYDGGGNLIYQHSMDAGERRMLANVVGKPMRAWDSRGHTVRTVYDELQRPTHLFVQPESGDELLAEFTVYGEAQGAANNHRGRVFQQFDAAGVVTNEAYDFKGNLRRNTRRLLVHYKDQVDWNQNPALENEVFANATLFDALNRVIQHVAPHSDRPGTTFNVIQPIYNEANLLERLDAWLQQPVEPSSLLDAGTASLHAVTDIDYNAKGQRRLIKYGNGVQTEYTYDRETFRLTHLFTTRGAAFPDDCPSPPNPPCGVQNLSYTYDPVGNITTIRDDAQQTVFFDNTQVEPHCDYTYDALYRLIRAEGREHAAQNNIQRDAADFVPVIGIPFPNSPEALQHYMEEYTYDSVGNILSMAHRGGGVERWTRRYQYAADSNRLLATSLPGNPANGPLSAQYTHDAHGNMTRMPHLPLMRWDFKDQLQATSRQVRDDGGTPKTTYYVYNSAGQRVRKVTERQADPGQTPTRMKERIYLGGFERYREYNGDGSTVILERETLHVMDDTKRVALVETRAQGNDGSPIQLTRYQLSNHLDSVMLEVDEAAAVISYEEYHPYGTSAYRACRSEAEVSLKRYRYTGKERDEETGLYYHGARYYTSWLGRWTAVDPIGLGDGVNRYAYVQGNPVGARDPTGKAGESILSDLVEQQIALMNDILVTESVGGNVTPLVDELEGVVNEERSAETTRTERTANRSSAGGQRDESYGLGHPLTAIRARGPAARTNVPGFGAFPQARGGGETRSLIVDVAAVGVTTVAGANAALVTAPLAGIVAPAIANAAEATAIAAVVKGQIFGWRAKAAVTAAIESSPALKAAAVAVGESKIALGLATAGVAAAEAYATSQGINVPGVTTGIGIPSSSSTPAKFLANATQEGPKGVSPIGSAIQSHASRPGSFFTSAGGNAQRNTEIGQKFLNDLFANPQTTVTNRMHKVHGPVVDYRLPNGAGAQFTEQGRFVGLLERFTRR